MKTYSVYKGAKKIAEAVQWEDGTITVRAMPVPPAIYMKNLDYAYYDQFLRFFVEAEDDNVVVENFELRSVEAVLRTTAYTSTSECYHGEGNENHARWILAHGEHYAQVEWCAAEEEVKIVDSNINKDTPSSHIERVRKVIACLLPKRCVLGGGIGDRYKLHTVLLFDGVFAAELSEEKSA
jgi:hypothetical protein